MRIAGVKSCSCVDGIGVRYVIFLQGCPHHCHKCHNPETWDFDGGYEITVEELAEDISKHRLIDGITLSGGEPFNQQEECVKLLKLLPDDTNVWIYTGYLYGQIKNTELAGMADVIVDGKFEYDKKCESLYFGSANQRIIEKGSNLWQQTVKSTTSS